MCLEGWNSRKKLGIAEALYVIAEEGTDAITAMLKSMRLLSKEKNRQRKNPFLMGSFENRKKYLTTYFSTTILVIAFGQLEKHI